MNSFTQLVNINFHPRAYLNTPFLVCVIGLCLQFSGQKNMTAAMEMSNISKTFQQIHVLNYVWGKEETMREQNYASFIALSWKAEQGSALQHHLNTIYCSSSIHLIEPNGLSVGAFSIKMWAHNLELGRYIYNIYVHFCVWESLLMHVVAAGNNVFSYACSFFSYICRHTLCMCRDVIIMHAGCVTTMYSSLLWG